MVPHFAELENKHLPDWVAICDPAGTSLGSGGGTAHVLAESWKQTGHDQRFGDWLRDNKRLMIHSGGQSRRLPAYAAVGKILIPIPVFRWAKGQRIDQTLLDLQLPLYQHILAQSPKSARIMVACGDVLLRSQGPLPPLPDVDVLCFGMWADPETATHHGVFFSDRTAPEQLQFFLQKPNSEKVRQIAADHLFQIDTGIWLFSERAVRVLMERSGWDWQAERFAGDIARTYELFAEFGLSLGTSPTEPDDEISPLTVAVVPLPHGEFYHFGTSRELIRSCLRLQNLVLDQREFGVPLIKPHPEMFVQNAPLEYRLKSENRTLWAENAALPAEWSLAGEHVITGIPDHRWTLRLAQGTCLDIVPVGTNEFCLRVYGMDDVFRGPIGDEQTMWCGRSAKDWFAHRQIRLQDAGIPAETDLQEACLFPVVDQNGLDPVFLQWALGGKVEGVEESMGQNAARDEDFRRRWLSARRLSARQIVERADPRRIYAQRRRYRDDSLLALTRHSDRSVFYNLDLSQTAELYAHTSHPLPEEEPSDAPLMRRVHQRMFAAKVRRLRGEAGWESDEGDAFRLLREDMIDGTREQPVTPTRQLLDDQIIWGRAPVRLDLAGGWTDTPPYCLNHGGKVVNVAVNLNGQPPIQVFVRISDKPQVVLRSIDLGVEERISTYDQLRAYAEVGSSFSIAKAAMALAGFLPEFAGDTAPSSLEQQLESFGGGIEISLLAAVPKGSGLGTSSILAGTLLGSLSELCTLNWDLTEICRRTLTLEQMLTTGGGWQDQVGGVARGLKLTETRPGLVQEPVIRWLSPHLFTDPASKSCMLLYYTGITRVAKNILVDIVRGMFLNSAQHLSILSELGDHALATYEMLMRGRWEGLCESIARSWQLNQRLDSGTNPPAVQAILDLIAGDLSACKLLGAGGGGYMLMLAKDPPATVRIRRTLEQSPPNPRARFIDFDVSSTGLEITRS